MLLTKLRIDDFKRVDAVEIDLADINILVGANGSGKSSIIQAVHLACCVMRQADRIEATKTSTVGVDELDYLPTDNYKMLGFQSTWGNRVGSPSSKVQLVFSQEQAQFTATCELRSARNAGISITGAVPRELTDVLRKKGKFFSAYIPGISGIPNKEDKKSRKVILKACSYGDSNIILRNVLLLLQSQNQQNIALIESWISKIIGPVHIVIRYDEDRDLYISCDVEIGGDTRPLELIGTGYLQLIQIFSYILLFEPGILLIDEPDIHLHPTAQERLAGVLANVAAERKIRVLLTTHSPFVIRGSPVNARVYWVSDGVIDSGNRHEVEFALGWGAFGKKVIIISEDSKTALLRKLVSQWPELEKFATFYPGTGYKSLVTPKQASEISASLGGKYKILVHRDRDSMTDQEVQRLREQYAAEGVCLWVTDQSDVESYFCSAAYIRDLVGCTEAEAEQYVENVLTTHTQPIWDQFNAQRARHNQEFYAQGGSPANQEVWTQFQGRPLRGAKGKYVFGQLQNRISGNRFNLEAILAHNPQVQLAPELGTLLGNLVTD